MAAFFIYLGLAIYTVGGLMVIREARQSGEPGAWVVLVSPLFGFGIYRRHWHELQVAAYLQVVGIGAVFAGILLLFQNHPRLFIDPYGYFYSVQENSSRFSSNVSPASQAFVDSDEALLLAVKYADNDKLAGQLVGKPFEYERVELINGVLRVKDSPKLIPNREVAVFLGIDDSALDKTYKKEVVASSVNVPRVHVSWIDEQGEFHTRIIATGYRMQFEAVRVKDNQIAGFLQIILPDEYHSFLSGSFIGYTNHLQYRDGKVDLSYDHPDTIAYVAREHLYTQFPPENIDDIRFEHTHIKSASGLASTTALISMKDGGLVKRDLELHKGDFGWVVSVKGVPQTVLLKAASKPLPKPSELPVSSQEDVTTKAAPKEPVYKTFEELAEFANRSVTVLTRDGKREQGVFTGLKKGKLVIETIVGVGTVEYFVSAKDFVSMILENGQEIRLKEAAETETGPSAEAASVPKVESPPVSAPEAAQPVANETEGADAASEAVPASREDSEYDAFVGKLVQVATASKQEKGVLKRIEKKKLVIEKQVGAGVIEIFVPVSEVTDIQLTSE